MSRAENMRAKSKAETARTLSEVDYLLGDPSKANEQLGWQPETNFPDLVQEMMESDLKAVGLELE